MMCAGTTGGMTGGVTAVGHPCREETATTTAAGLDPGGGHLEDPQADVVAEVEAGVSLTPPHFVGMSVQVSELVSLS